MDHYLNKGGCAAIVGHVTEYREQLEAEEAAAAEEATGAAGGRGVEGKM